MLNLPSHRVLFYPEVLQSSIKVLQKKLLKKEREYENYKALSWNAPTKVHIEIYKDLRNLLSYSEYHALRLSKGPIRDYAFLAPYSIDSVITLYIVKKMAAIEYDIFLDYIENLFKEYNYVLDVDQSHDRHYAFINSENKEEKVWTAIDSAICTPVKTGRLITEEIKDCSFIGA